MSKPAGVVRIHAPLPFTEAARPAALPPTRNLKNLSGTDARSSHYSMSESFYLTKNPARPASATANVGQTMAMYVGSILHRCDDEGSKPFEEVMSYLIQGRRPDTTVPSVQRNPSAASVRSQSDLTGVPDPAPSPAGGPVPQMQQRRAAPSVELAYQRNYLPELVAAVTVSDTIHFRSRGGEPLAIDAAQHGKTEALTVLLSRGDTPDLADADGKSLLIIAASADTATSSPGWRPTDPT